MRPRRPSPEHEQAVARRLALLSAELAAVRAELPPEPGNVPAATGVAPGPLGWEGEHTRVRPLADPADAAPPAPGPGPTGAGPSAPHLPVPGRHAARRAWVAWLPVQGRVGLQPAHLAVVALLVAVGLGWTTWWVVQGQPRTTAVPPRSDASPVAVTAPGGASGGATTAPGPAGPGPAGPGRGAPAGSLPPSGGEAAGDVPLEVVVDVAGRVRRPGLVVLPAGSRVADALEAAGGARRGVDLVSLNLARVLVDGEQLLVGVRVPAGAVAGAPSPAPPGTVPSPAGGLVNLNTADEALLDTLPGVGPVTAAAIVAWRTEHGGFTAVEELLEVNGIGEVTLAELAPLVTV